MFSTMGELYHFAAGATAGVAVTVIVKVILRIMNDKSNNLVNQSNSKVGGDQAGRDIKKH